MDRLAAMETLVRVVETGSFSGAARQLRVGQPAVSKSVAQLVRMGFVSRVVPAAELERIVAETCEMIAENAPLTVAAAKFAVQQALKDPADRDMAKAQKMAEACFASADHKEGRQAFMAKRKPIFTGR